MSVKFEVGVHSDIGKRRKQNEDCFKISAGKRLFIVADGMGGHAKGEIASSLATATFTALFKKNRSSTLIGAIHAAHQKIKERQRQDVSCAGMGTTLTALHIDRKGGTHIGHVGDSRLYRLRQGKLQRLTEDHNYQERYVLDGSMTKAEAKAQGLDSALTQVIGINKIKPQHLQEQSQHNDVYLLCSDGLNGQVEDTDIRTVLAKVAEGKAHAQKAAEKLVQKANDAGGKDNITALIVRVLHNSVKA